MEDLMNFVPTASGKAFNIVKPDPDTITIEDIAHHLSQINRFTGATKRPYSVAEHSLMVSYIVSPENAVQALLHDASEAYLNDVTTPVKRLLPKYRDLETVVQKAICDKFHIDFCLSEEVKQADMFALVCEGEYFFNKGVWQNFWESKFSDFIDSIDDHGWYNKWEYNFNYNFNVCANDIKNKFIKRAYELGLNYS